MAMLVFFEVGACSSIFAESRAVGEPVAAPPEAQVRMAEPVRREFPIKEEIKILRAEKKNKMPYLDKKHINEVINVEYIRAKEAFAQTKVKTYEEVIARAVEVYLRMPGAEWQAAQPLSLIWVTYHNRHRYDEAEGYAKLALALLERSSQVSPWQLIGTLENLALTYQAHGRYEQAEELYRRSLGLQEKLEGGAASYRLESTLRNLRTVLRELGKYEESGQMQARADQMLQQLKASRAAAQGQAPTSP